MRRSLAIFTAFALLLSYFTFLTPRVANAASQICYVFDAQLTNYSSGPLTATIFFYDLSTNKQLSGENSVTLNPGESGTLHLDATIDAGIAVGLGGGPGGLAFTINFGPTGDNHCTGGRITDGRINAYDEGAPLAAYCTADHGIAVWDIDDTGHGTLAFTVTKADITKALSDAIASGHNVLVGQGMGDSLYALSSNQLTLTGPDIKEPAKTYEFVTAADRCG